MVHESLQDHDFLNVVCEVEVGYGSVPTHHVGIVEFGCSGGKQGSYPVNE